MPTKNNRTTHKYAAANFILHDSKTRIGTRQQVAMLRKPCSRAVGLSPKIFRKISCKIFEDCSNSLRGCGWKTVEQTCCKWF